MSSTKPLKKWLNLQTLIAFIVGIVVMAIVTSFFPVAGTLGLQGTFSQAKLYKMSDFDNAIGSSKGTAVVLVGWIGSNKSPNAKLLQTFQNMCSTYDVPLYTVNLEEKGAVELADMLSEDLTPPVAIVYQDGQEVGAAEGNNALVSVQRILDKLVGYKK